MFYFVIFLKNTNTAIKSFAGNNLSDSYAFGLDYKLNDVSEEVTSDQLLNTFEGDLKNEDYQTSDFQNNIYSIVMYPAV